MTPTREKVQTLVEHCEPFRDAKFPGGYPDSLALCVVDSIQSSMVTYSSVVNVVNRYRQYRHAQGSNPATDGAHELLVTFDELRGANGWAKEIGNDNKTSTHRGAPLKAVAIREAAKALSAKDIFTTQDLRDVAQDPDRLAQVGAAWLAVSGQSSRITWHYVQMLAGLPGIKPDRMIRRFIAKAIGTSVRSVTPEFAVQLLIETATEMGVSPTDLDHGIWQWQRKRR
jgi:hypothetical protein